MGSADIFRRKKSKYGKKAEHLPDFREIRSFLRPFFVPLRKYFLLLGGMTLGESLLVWGIPLLQARLISGLAVAATQPPETDRIFSPDHMIHHRVLKFLILTLLAMGVQLLVQKLTEFWNMKILLKLNVSVRDFLHGKILRVRQEYFESVHSGGTAMRIFYAGEVLCSFCIQSIPSLVVSFLLAAGCLSVLGMLAWWLPLIFLGLLCIHWQLQLFLARRRQDLSCRSNRELLASWNVSQETFKNMSLIKSAVAESHLHYRLNYHYLRQKAISVIFYRQELLAFFLNHTLTFLLHGGIGAIGLYGILSGKWELGVLWGIQRYTSLTEKSLFRLSGIREQFEIVRARALPLFELLRQGEEPYGEAAGRLGPLNEIAFHQVDFAYPASSTPILQKLNFKIPRGSFVVLTGTSGSGKSTITKLLLGFCRPTRGQIMINGKPLDHIALPQLRRRIGYVHQRPFFFSGSMEANLKIGNPRASTRELRSMLTQVGLDEVAARIGQAGQRDLYEDGKNFSAGQQLRLTIVREMLKRPEVLILDEPTAALDGLSAAEVIRLCLKRKPEQTILLITHNCELMKFADHIFLLENGHITAEGGYFDLRKSSPAFCKIIEASGNPLNPKAQFQTGGMQNV